jgi:hypothetical protein
VKEIILRNGIGADGAAGAFLAKITEGKLIDPLHHGAEMSGIVGEKSRFKVAFVREICPKSCARVNGVLGCEYFYNRVTFTKST